ncbi:MAG: type I-G CRISPR-associated RAMP protein Csb1/Cas7g [Actinomycetota bacterium]
MNTTGTAARTVLEIELAPLAGSRFQPTGFPDLGAATFERPDGAGGWTNALLVESVQSMANRLEQTTWDAASSSQVAALEGVPFVRVVDPDGVFLTSSRLEAHRLAAAYIMDGQVDGQEGRDWLRDRLGLVEGRPLDHASVAGGVLALDPLSLVHGVFFAQKKWPWQPKVARAVTCFVEAHDVRPAVSGGVKRDSVVNEAKDKATSEGYGMVPHHRTEFTAARLVAYVNVDRDQLRSFGLGDAATALLDALVDYEIGTLFRSGLRLRTACDLAVVDVSGGDLPDPDAAAARVHEAVAGCGELLGPVRDVVWAGRTKRS